MLYEDIGSKRGLVLTWVPLAIDVHRLAGDLDTAEAIGRENVDTTAKTVDAYASTAAAQLAHLLVQRGDLEAADRYATLSEQTRSTRTCTCSSLACRAGAATGARRRAR